MKAKDLRVGNLVKQPDRIGKVQEIWSDAVRLEGFNNGYSYGYTEPIPLAEKWLLKLGFNRVYHKLTGEHSHLPSHFNLNGFRIDVEYYCGSEEVCYYEFNLYPNADLKYVHQLQNLFFAITGQELELN